jgi:hypothetical protein
MVRFAHPQESMNTFSRAAAKLSRPGSVAKSTEPYIEVLARQKYH